MVVRDERGAIAFAEKLLALLDQARTTATYKFAVLLGLTDLCLAGFTRAGTAPDSVTTDQLAAAVTALYWNQVRPFGAEQTLLRQNRGGQARITELIRAARSTLAGGAEAPLGRARAQSPGAYARLVRDVEWTLVEMPLPKLQRVGGRDVRFIYEIAWDDQDSKITRTAFNERRFDNQVRFRDGVGDHLVRLSGLLRPMLQRRWALEVSRLNPAAGLDSELEDHLFGARRIDLAPVRGALRELQDGRCFYCHGPLRNPQVDHFIPWARVPLDAIENLVLADDSCNRSKCDSLAATDHVAEWAGRLDGRASDLVAIAATAAWESAPARVLGTARALYLPLADDALLWSSPDVFTGPDTRRLAQALS